MNLRSDIDWFDLKGEVSFDGVVEDLPRLLAAAGNGESFVELSDGSFGLLPEDWNNQILPLARLGQVDTKGKKIRFGKAQAALIDALLEDRDATEFSADREFEEMRKTLHSFEGIEPQSEPEGFQGSLRDYQRQGLGWLHFLDEFGFGGCLADDMGLGKTVQVLSLLEQNRKKKKHPSLAVVPKSLVHNWIEEAARFTPQMRVLEYSGKERANLQKVFSDYDLIVMTYAVMRRDIISLKELKFDFVILDEAQAIKNASSQSSKASRLLQSRRRIAVTGTPVENHLGELGSIFGFLNPGMLGHVLDSGELRSGMKITIPETNEHGHVEEGGVEAVPSPSEGLTPLAGVLSRALRPFILRRTKGQVLKELPEKTEQTIYCDLEDEQKQLYEELRDHYRLSLEKRIQDVGIKKSKMHVLEALLRLRQAACHPGLIDKTRMDEGSAKVETLLEQLEELIDEGHKALVFSQFTSFLEILSRRLKLKGVPFEYLDGKTKDRKERVERFQTDPKCPLFLISLRAGGLGLNLTAADYCFIMDPWWNPAVEAQAIDRTHRLGQTRKVFAYRLIARNTVEEKILELQKGKKQLAEAVISADVSFLQKLSVDDLKLLLS